VAFIRPISQLPHDRQCHGDTQRLLGAEIHQRVVALQAQHHADKQAGDEDDHERQHPHRPQLRHHQAGAAQQTGEADEGVQQEQVGAAQLLELTDTAAAEFPYPLKHLTGLPHSPAPDNGTAQGRPAAPA
jgi:hypothetical protein